MNRLDLIKKLAVNTGTTQKDAKVFLEAFTDTVIEALQEGEDVNIKGFGKFVTTHREARVGRNPQTGEEIEIPAKTNCKFKASVNLKSLLNA